MIAKIQLISERNEIFHRNVFPQGLQNRSNRRFAVSASRCYIWYFVCGGYNEVYIYFKLLYIIIYNNYIIYKEILGRLMNSANETAGRRNAETGHCLASNSVATRQNSSKLGFCSRCSVILTFEINQKQI